MNPDDFLKVVSDLKPKVSIPIHWGTFRLGFDKVDEPLEHLKKLLKKKKKVQGVKILNPGESVSI